MNFPKYILALALASTCLLAPAQTVTDPHLALEDLKDAASTRWVDEQTDRTLGAVKKMPGFEERYKANLKVLTQREFNIQYPSTVAGVIYNHYRAANQPGGIWRSTSMEEYRKARPDWRVLFNIDAYNREQSENWTWGGAQVQPLALQNKDGTNVRALVRLSRGGGDAAVIREFDVNQRRFVSQQDKGFEIQEAKGWAYWWSANELLVSTDFGADSLTASGYPREVRLWKRGTPLSSAVPVFKAEASDVSVGWWTDIGLDGRKFLLVKRQVSFFQNLYFAWDGQALKALDLPADSAVRIDEGHLLVEPRVNWTSNGQQYPAGSLLIAKFSDFQASGQALRMVFEPADRKTLTGYLVTKAQVVVNESHDMQSRVFVHALGGTGTGQEVKNLGEFGLVRTWVHDANTNKVWLQHQGFLEPQTLYLLDTASLELEKIYTQGPVTDSSQYRVERGNAKSSDGTLIPYTVIQRKDAPRDGNQATLLYGYGGFGISLLPEYQRFALLNWLDFGGTYVLAHIRGGGEFGTAWTKAAKGLKRQTGFDDFAAVAQSLIDTKLTQASRLGIYGASNGGLLVSTVLVQHPELFGAMVSRVPLTDLQRYTKLLAGPSWVEEYGDPDKADDWAVMSRYSPYQNLKPGARLPPALYITNNNDDRVHPAHGRKMAAKQQALGYPTWFYEPREGGHGGVSTPQLQAEREALLYTFLMSHLAGTSAK